MASAPNLLRGNALPQLINALRRLQDDPELLAREREQYRDSPPPYPSGETTQPPSLPRSPSESQLEWQREEERKSSVPGRQFKYQTLREYHLLIEQIRRRRERRKYTLPYDDKLDLIGNAENNVKNRWIEQGIWNDKWSLYSVGPRWKHEEPLEPPPAPDPKPQPRSSSHPRFTFGLFGLELPECPKPQEPPIAYTEEQLASKERERAASRPYHQFLFQMSKEREWIEDELYIDIFDMDAKVYENVKNRWIEQKIWNPRWGDMPGMTWIHEEPDNHESDISNHPVAVPEEGFRANAAEIDAQSRHSTGRRIYFGLASSEANHDQRGRSRSPSVPRMVVDSNGAGLGSTTTKKTKRSSRAAVNMEGTPVPRESANRTLRADSSSKVRKHPKRNPPRRHLQKRIQDMAGSADARRRALGNLRGTEQQEQQADDANSSPTASQLPQRNLRLDTGESPPVVRRSSRIEARSGTSKSTMYDTAPAPTPARRRRRRSQQVNPEISANPRQRRGVLKNRPRRQETTSSLNAQPEPRRKGRLRVKAGLVG
ncbi:predicted protein [Histoplasma capsulatum G186AR]|uniref:Uncharacterized protein n=1 Tax=Ajellomyces capsulatus (strain G186AR / H82 / ATCC MYA-2454 / RMSCC 2432) TaxID=447093 RepID=C0NRG9_AJECG|nr:uncharacterized protein HCBG_05599 [Histoplasma capsulatum G186AR]EEH06283.1 predicted protein [Histoplasma capsulatum G186AR]